MIFLRSLTFHTLFFIMNLVFGVVLLWLLLLPRDWAWKALFHYYFNLIYKMEKMILGLDFRVQGRENIPDPESGAYIVAMKHQSAYETLKLFHIFGDIRIILKKELLWIPLWGWYARKLGMIPVDRGRGKVAIQSILHNAAPVIAGGTPILIYPQGTRVSIDTTTAERPYKQGAIRLYEHFQVPILPVALNSGRFHPRKAFLIKPGIVDFKILPPIPAGQPADQVQQQLQDLIEVESQKLL